MGVLISIRVHRVMQKKYALDAGGSLRPNRSGSGVDRGQSESRSGQGDGNTALSTAAFLCHVEVVEALLKAGADKNVKNAGGTTAYASVAGDFEDVRFIYDILNNAIFKPMGQPLDYQRIQTSRPKIAAMLE